MSEIILESVLTCPHCDHTRPEIMPTDACQYFYECVQCKTLLRPKAGDCCVFCSYGSERGIGYISRVIPSAARNVKISPFGRNDSVDGIDVNNITHPKPNSIAS